jgi:hypothetical protein
MATEEGLLREVDSNLLRNGKVGQQHELFNEPVRVILGVVVTVDWRAVLVKVEHEAVSVDAQRAVLGATPAKLLGEAMESEDILCHLGLVMVIVDSNGTGQQASLNRSLSISIGELGSGSTKASADDISEQTIGHT